MNENNNKSMTFRVKCEDCTTESLFDQSKVVFNEEHKFNGKKVFLTYVTCPKCGRRLYVQIDNLQSFEIRKQVTKMMIKASKARIDGKQLPKSQSEKFKKTRTYLNEIRKELMEEYTGKSMHDDDTGQTFELRFVKV